MVSQGETGLPPNPAKILEVARAQQLPYILRAGVDLDVFTAIAQGSHTVGEIARVCKASERGVRILCDSLTIMGFLMKTENSYSLMPDSAFFLDSRSPAYMGKALKFLLHHKQLENLEHLTETVRRGGSSAQEDTFAPEDPIWVDFARGMAPITVPAAQAIAKMLQPTLAGKPAPKVLDIAAGHGTFGITVAQQIPDAQVFAVDWANVLEVARENAKARGVDSQIHMLPGNAFEIDFGSGYDAALITNFLHHFDVPTNERLLKKVRNSLNPGGQVLILEFVPNDDRITPAPAAIFAMTMLSNTPHGDAYTFTELAGMCRNSGFDGERLAPLHPLPHSLVVARRA